MKPILIVILFSLMTTAVDAQQKQQVAKDTLPAKLTIQNTVATRTTKPRATTETEINEKLNNLLNAYINKPNTQTTWKQIKGEAQNILLPYFRNGSLMGTKAEEAFFVKMGNETMTQTDIVNHRMILQVGIATIKPSEFKILVVEKINTSL